MKMIKIKKLKFQNSITFSNVEFKFSSNNEKTLENINFEIKKKDFIAIVGKTGTGKTTFLNLLMGLLKPSTGKIEIDGINIHNNIEAWRANLGYVPQNINLLDESLKKNIAYGLKENSISNINVKKVLNYHSYQNF